MTEENKEKLDKAVEDMAERIRLDSIKTGAKLICSVVLQKARENKPYNQRLNEIVQFCTLAMGKINEDS